MPKARTIAFLVVATTSLVDHTDSALAQAQPCRAREYAHNAYTVCEVDLAKHTVRLYWKRSDGIPYAYLSSLPRVLEHETGRLLFGTNAGMFDPAFKPVGLYVEQGRELVHVNTSSGYGISQMKPNGIFYMARRHGGRGGNTGISQAAPPDGPGDAIGADAGDKRARASSLRPGQYLAQSAHWRWSTRGWQSHICHLPGRGVVRRLARLFRDGLNCPNALFLDGGSASSFYASSLNSHGNILSLGPMLAVFERDRGAGRPRV